MKIAILKCGRQTATMELTADGFVSVYGKTAQKRSSEISATNIAELPISDVMLFRDRRSIDEPLTGYLQSIVDEIWEQVAEDESWFAFCSPSFAEQAEIDI